MNNVFEDLKSGIVFDFRSIMELPTIHFEDIIDIIIVAFIIYQVLVWIRDTRAWTLFKGIIFIITMALIAAYLQLNTILWIFQNTISVGILAVIIVFQPELRRALEQLGRGNFISTLINDEIRDKKLVLNIEIVNELINAIKIMSAAKTGALIAIEQDVKLGDFERTGIPIDAKISEQLMINIFEHNTPLHDGAVILRENRISAATCFLPLSDNPNISMSLGTRHRAALGLSEVSDAKVIVVSEETGIVSMAKGGRLYRNIDEDFIKNQLITEPKKKNNIKIAIWKGRHKNE